MDRFAYEERLPRGTRAFPAAFYRVTPDFPRYHMPPHWHMEEELVWVEQGALTLQLDGRPLPLQAGDAALIRSGELHSGRPQNCIYHCLVFDSAAFFERIPDNAAETAALLRQEQELQLPFRAGTRAADAAAAVFAPGEGPGREWLVTGALWQLFGVILAERLFSAPDRRQPGDRRRLETVKTALRRIRQDYAAPLTLSVLAEEAGVSPRYFCRLFREIAGKTPIDYLRAYRLERAADLLRTTGRSVTEIALECGFGDLSYFTRSFSRYMGQAPGAYRKKTRED